MKYFFIVLMLLTAYSTVAFPTATYRGIVYDNSYVNQTIDIYIPARFAATKNGEGNAGTPYPAIVAIGDTPSDSCSILQILQALPYGYAVIVPEYDKTPANDTKSVGNIISITEWIKKQGHEYRLDPDKIILWGYSKGGYIAALAGCAGTYLQGFESQMEFGTSNTMAVAQKSEQALQKIAESFGIYSAGNDTKVQAVVDIYGMFSIPQSSITPQMFITPQSPPFFILASKKETLAPYNMADNFTTSLRGAIGGERVEYLLLPDTIKEEKISENTQLFSQIFVFLNRVLH